MAESAAIPCRAMAHGDGQRLKAARALGGYRTPAMLAEAIGRAKFGERTIRSVEQGKRQLEDYEAAWVAEACGISPAFFTVDLAGLHAEPAPNATRAADAAVDHLLEAARALVREEEQGDPSPGALDRQRRAAGGHR